MQRGLQIGTPRKDDLGGETALVTNEPPSRDVALERNNNDDGLRGSCTVDGDIGASCAGISVGYRAAAGGAGGDPGRCHCHRIVSTTSSSATDGRRARQCGLKREHA
jgi:hypothetical protein